MERLTQMTLDGKFVEVSRIEMPSLYGEFLAAAKDYEGSVIVHANTKDRVRRGMIIQSPRYDHSADRLLVAQLTADRRLPRSSEQLFIERTYNAYGKPGDSFSMISIWRDPEFFQIGPSEFILDEDVLGSIQIALMEMTDVMWNHIHTRGLSERQARRLTNSWFGKTVPEVQRIRYDLVAQY